MDTRIATVDDANELFELNTLFENTTTIENIRKSLEENNAEIVSIAFIDGIAAGYCCGLIIKSMCYSENRADIEALYVKEEFRRQGVGAALIKCLENALADLNILHFHINTHSNNVGAQSLYKGLGYCKTGEILMDKRYPAPNGTVSG